MLGENALPVYLVVGIVVTLAIGSTFTPVIARTTWVDPVLTDNQNVVQEYSYCQTNMNDVNCSCFANVAGYVLSDKSPDFRGTVSMDKVELARYQASQSC